MKLKSIVILATFLFFLILGFLRPSPASAQASCSMEQIFQSCGPGGIACLTAAPTSTPTGVPVNPWIKVKSSSFSASSSNSLNGFSIPLNSGAREKFNNDDDDDDNTANFLIGSSDLETGVVSAPAIGSGLTGAVSTNNWVVNGYDRQKQFSPSKFLDYARARKDFVTITNTGQIQTNKVNIIEAPVGGLIIDGSNAGDFIRTGGAAAPFVLVVNGDMTIRRDINAVKALDNSPDSSYTPYPLTLVVTGTLTISSSDTQPNHVNMINAVVMAENLVVSATNGADTRGLKITGNLIVQEGFTNLRVRDSSTRPVIFIVQDPTMYISLLPYFSTADYEWRQLQ